MPQVATAWQRGTKEMLPPASPGLFPLVIYITAYLSADKYALFHKLRAIIKNNESDSEGW